MLFRNLGRLKYARKTSTNFESYDSYGQFRETRSMQKLRKIVIVSQHYPPDRSTTATIMSALAEHLATVAQVLVLSGTSGSALSKQPSQLSIVEVNNWQPAKAALLKRTVAEVLFTVRTFFELLTRLQRGDVALTVTAPFMLSYAVVAAAKLKRAKSALILHDLFPDVLVVAGILNQESLVAKAIRGANALMFRMLNSIIVIGRDTERLLSSYGKGVLDKISFIPNWATLPPGIRPITADNYYRQLCKPRFVVGLSGNLGFTHDPLVVFEAARLLQEDPTIHFLLSGWGIGFERLKALQSEANLPNVTMIDRVAEQDLEGLLSAADIWVIPYRNNVAGVSIPSRFYNLLAIGRAVVLISEPEAEAAVAIRENGLGWVVSPGRPDELATTLRLASLKKDPSMAERAVAVARGFSLDRATTSYASLIRGLLGGSE
jgi:colanic acid biosynthesis glycosyl transferase WcaI